MRDRQAPEAAGADEALALATSGGDHAAGDGGARALDRFLPAMGIPFFRSIGAA
jgi:hypothetical protein